MLAECLVYFCSSNCYLFIYIAYNDYITKQYLKNEDNKFTNL
jgi:hypothetical protein